MLTGGNGQVGFELARALSVLAEIVSLNRTSFDLAQPEAIADAISHHLPDVIVNAAAYTAVDRAESEPEKAFAVNAKAVEVMARAAAERGILLVHYSTDYVFDGDKTEPYTETDAPNPQSVYGRSKLAGELAASACERHLILRTSWVFSARGTNFLRTILRLAAERESLNVVGDQFGAPTSAALIADITAHLIVRYLREGPRSFPYGTYHLAAGGETSWYNYACLIVRKAIELGVQLRMTESDIHLISARDYPQSAPRPANSRMATGKLTSTFEVELPPWQAGVEHVLALLLQR